MALRLTASCVRHPCHVAKRSFFSLPNVVPDFIRNSSRKEYTERQLLNFSQQQVYNVVANVKDYKDFVPFCNHSHIHTSRQERRGDAMVTIFHGELGVGYKMFEEKYTSVVTCQEPRFVQAVSADASLFKELVTTWRFTPNVPPSQLALPESAHHPSCYVDFNIMFEFASPLHAQASTMFFDQVSRMMLKAFIDRCNDVYKTR